MALRIERESEPIPGYRLIERLGGGGFGEVWKVEAPGGLLKAIKVIHGDLRTDDQEANHLATQELKALNRVKSVRHPYLLSLERIEEVEGRLLIVMELADRNLWDRFRECRNQGLPGVPRDELLGYLHEAAEVLDLMSSQHQLQHLDIKPQNIFLVHNHIKVADFGLVKDLEGMRAAVTGGVTPIYAAPETFEGEISRYCDQYSLAIVYQELLTGQRPFNGLSMQQLLMQHLSAAPNLGSLPPGDRPAVAKALSKKPEDRFHACMDFVRALRQSGTPGDRLPAPVRPAPSLTKSDPTLTLNRARLSGVIGVSAPMDTPRTLLRRRTDVPRADDTPSLRAESAAPPPPAPPEITGPGTLLPAVIVAAGGVGRDALCRFRRQVAERFGAFDRVASLKAVYVDTDPAALQEATEPARGLKPDEVVAARLNRAAHYLKPRRNGRSLIEGWFDPSLLYRIPRNSTTGGLRALGRLAFCDHYRSVTGRVLECVEECTREDALVRANDATRLGLRSNRPRVYVLAGLGGGTGSGMLLDLAYAVRHRLRRIGYERPEVVGVLLLPPLDRNPGKAAALANAYAALKELNHFAGPGGVFAAEFDDADGTVRDADAPFTRFVLVPPGDSLQSAADLLRHELLGPGGRAADEARAARQEGRKGVAAGAFGLTAFAWPREAILARAGATLVRGILSNWVATDPKPVRDRVRGWVQERWEALGLGWEALAAHFAEVCRKAVGKDPEAYCDAEADPFVPRGWRKRDPDPARLWDAVRRLQELVGVPDERLADRPAGKLEAILAEAADELGRTLTGKVAGLAEKLVETPDLRVTGAEEAIRQLQDLCDDLRQQNEAEARELSDAAVAAYYLVQNYLTAEKGQPRPTGAETAEALRLFPKCRYRVLVLRQASAVYARLRGQVASQMREVGFCRQRLQEVLESLATPPAEAEPADVLLPPGCQSVGHAVQKLLDGIKPDDQQELQKRVQARIEREFAALFHVCMSSANLLGGLRGVLQEQVRAFLQNRLPGGDVADLFFARHATPERAADALRRAFDAATPALLPTALDDSTGFCVLGVPAGPSGQRLKELAAEALADENVAHAPAADEIVVYREFDGLPLTSLPHLGPAGAESYRAALSGATPHARTDVRVWQDFEQG